MNRYEDPAETSIPDEAEYIEYLDSLEADRMRRIDDDLTRMFEADQANSAALRSFLDAADLALDNIEKILTSSN